MAPDNVTLKDIYEIVAELRGEMTVYRTCATCDERHKPLDLFQKVIVTAVVSNFAGIAFLAVRAAV